MFRGSLVMIGHKCCKSHGRMAIRFPANAEFVQKSRYQNNNLVARIFSQC